MEPPRWETEESGCILVPGMPLVMLPPWTAEREAGKKIIKIINKNNANNFWRIKCSQMCDLKTAVIKIIFAVMGIKTTAIFYC